MHMWIHERWKDLPRQELKWMIQAILEKRLDYRKVGSAHDPESLLDIFTVRERNRLNAWIIDRLINHKPLQYILRSQPFCGLEIRTRPPTLIPRWETEEWTLKVIELLKAYAQTNFQNDLRILDLCSGSGCISLAIASNLLNLGVNAQVVGIDHSLSAHRLALVNQRKLEIPKTRLSFIHADIFKDLPITGTFDVIVSNPPYISYNEYSGLSKDVLDWEDHSALFAKDDGLLFYKRIIDLIPFIVKKNSKSSVFLEVGGDSQAQTVYNLARQVGLRCNIWKDLAGISRTLHLKTLNA